MAPDLTVLDPEEAAYRQRSAALKLRNGIFSGIGAACALGLVSEIVKATVYSTGLIGAHATAVGGTIAAAATGSALGGFLVLGAIVAVGIGCIYYANKCFAESVALDQQHQAKLIQQAKEQSKSTAVVVEPTPTPTTLFDKGQQSDKAPETRKQHDAKSWAWIGAEPGPINAGTMEKTYTVNPFYSDKAPAHASEHAHADAAAPETEHKAKSWVEKTGAQPAAARAMPTDQANKDWASRTTANDNELAVSGAVRA